MEDIFSDLKPAQNKEPESIWDTTDKIQTMSFQNYGSSVDQDINMPTYKEPEYGETIINYNYSLSDLEKDPEFAKRASRFLDGIGRNEDIFEYLRDSDYSLSAAWLRSTEVGDWTKEQKQDYVYLRNKFGNANLKGFKERFNMVKDIGVDILFDPLNIVAALFAIPTGGISLGVRGALGAAAQAGVKKLTAAQLTKGAVAKTGGKKLTAYQLANRADLQKRLIRRDVPKAAKAGALFGAAEGMAWGGLHEYFMQDIDVDLDMRDGYDLSSIAGTTALTGIFGAGIGAGVSSLVTRNSKTYLTKQYKHSNENLIDDVAGSQSRLEIFKDSIIDSGLYKKGKLGLSKAISKTFGKPTTWFQEYVDKSPELKAFMQKLRYDWDSTLTSRGERGVKEKSFGLFLGETVGKFQYGLAKSLNVLYRVGWRARLDPIQNKELVEMLRNNTLTLKNIDKKAKGGKYTPEVVTAYKGVRETLDAAFDEANLAGLFGESVRLAAGYFPRLFRYDVLEAKQDIFKKHLIKSGHADPINFMPPVQIIEDTTDEIKKGILRDAKNIDEEIFGIDFLKGAGVKESVIGSGKNKKIIYSLDDATPEQILKAKEDKADQIVKDMLEYRWTPFELRSSNQGKGSGYLQERRFRNIKDNDIAEFLEDDVQQILETYFTNTGQAIARSKYFGRTILEFDKNIIVPMKAELNASKMDATEIEAVIDRVRLTHRRVTGIETDARSVLKRNKWARTAADFGKLSQQMAHLPFATLSSITEPLLLLTRAGARDAPKVGRDIVSAIVQEGKNTLDRSWKGIQRGTAELTGARKRGTFKGTTGVKDIGTPSQKKGASIFDDMDDTTWGELYKTGLALEQAVQERIQGLAGEGMHNSVMKNIQAGFFKANLLTQWTKAVQLASFTTGKRLIKQRAQALYEHKIGKKLIRLTGDGRTSTTKYYIRQLNDLGVDENDAMEWYKKSLNSKGEFDAGLAKNVMLKSRQTGKDVNFYYGDYASGANRFTKEIILNPSTAEANRPLWFSTPSAQMLVQFAGYPTVFNNTILKRFSNELVESPAQSIPKVVPTVILMSAVAHMGNYIRSQGENMKDYETGFSKPDGEIVGEAIRRWGGFGPYDYVNRYGDEAERNLPAAIAAMKAFGGPLPQDAIDMVLFRKGLLELGVTNVPFYGALPASTRKDWRSAARGSTPKNPTTGYRGSLAKGGLVYNVPNVHPEPDEVKMRGSDQTYNEVAGVVLRDEEDRIFKNKGGTVYSKLQERKQLALGGLLGKMLGKGGLLFDPRNPLDYLMFVPGIGPLGIGAKALSSLRNINKLKKLPKTQYHGGYSSVEKGQINKTGIYSTPDADYASIYSDPAFRTFKGRGTPELYKLDLSKAKNVESLDKPSRKLKKALNEEIKKLEKKGTKFNKSDLEINKKYPELTTNRKPYFQERNLNKKDKVLYQDLRFKFRDYFSKGKGATTYGSTSFNSEIMGVRGGHQLRPEIMSWLRKNDVEILTDSKTLNRGIKGRYVDAEYFLIKDFPKIKLTAEDKAELVRLGKMYKAYNEGGPVTESNLTNFISLALEINNDRKNFVFGGISMLGRKALMKLLTKRINSPVDEKNILAPPEATIVGGKIKRDIDLTKEEKAKLDKEFFESGEAAEFNRSMIEDEMNKFHIKTGKELQDAIDDASEIISFKLQESGMSELEVTRLIKKAKKDNPNNEIFWAADKDLYKALEGTVSDKDLMTPAEQALHNFDEFGNSTGLRLEDFPNAMQVQKAKGGYRKMKAGEGLLIKKLKDSDSKVGDSENLINKYLNELTDKYSLDNLDDFGEPVRFLAFEDEVENMGLTTLYFSIPKAQQSKLEKLINKHKKLEIENQELYKQLYSIQDDS